MDKKLNNRKTFCFPNLSIKFPATGPAIKDARPPRKKRKLISFIENATLLARYVLKKGNIVKPPANVSKLINTIGQMKSGFFKTFFIFSILGDAYSLKWFFMEGKKK